MSENTLKTKTKDFWQKYEYKIILFLGFILVATISFEAGILKSQGMEQNPLIIEKPAVDNSSGQKSPEGQNLPSEAKNTSDNANALASNCAFLGSKNSNKYHLPTCRYAKNINPKNVVCFSDENQAKSKGYLPDKNCIK
ncbi:MAG TPA: hypothetical protein P5232_00425 [Candidatus Moranbacteria bacterium]|nr:hypothetical protein [Candidatus Moranbacteria bacterium]